MPRKDRTRLSRPRLFLSTLFALTALAGWQAAPAHLAGRASANAPEDGGGAQPLAEFVREAAVARVGDVVYNPGDKLLYVSVPSSAGAGGNSVVAVDPATGQPSGAPAFVGSEPSRLALADDNRTLYVALDGAYAVGRFDTQTRTAGAQFAVGQDSFHGPYRANDLAVAPGNPNLVAVARYYLGTSPPEAGVAVFDNGVQRTKTGPDHVAGANTLAFSASAAKLYGGGDQGLQTMTVDASGVTVSSTTQFQVGFRIKFAGGRIFSSAGQVVDPEAGTQLGTFSGVNTQAFDIDPMNNRAFYLTREFSSGALTLRAFDVNTFVLLGSATLTGVQGEPTALVRWGANGLALRTDAGRLYLIQTTLIPSSDPVPSPTPATPTPTPTPTPAPPATFVRQISLPTNDLVYNPATQALYASVPSAAGVLGNSVTRVDPETGEIGASTFVGSEPSRLALADDNQTMYVGLNGANAVRRLDISSQTAGLQFHLGGSDFGGFNLVDDMAVMPGSPGTVAVSRAGQSGGTADTVIYDDGVARAKTSSDGSPFPFGPAGGQVEFGATAARLYVGSGSVTRYSVAADGLTRVGSFITGGFGRTQFVGGLLYLSSGVVVDPETGEIKGRYTDPSSFGSDGAMAVDVPNGRVYLLRQVSSGWVLRSYDLDTFVPLASVPLQGVSDGSFSGPTSLVRWGKNGLAFRTSTRVFLINTALVDAAEPVPTPTPTPSPTPTPTPPYVATVVRPLDLPANDLVILPGTQTLYASVPSTAGARGNTLTAIDAQAGELGDSTFVGSEPTKMAVSDDGQVIYVNLEGAKAVRRFDVPTRTPGLQFGVGADRPPDMEVLPGTRDSLAVSRGTTFQNGVAVFDNGVQRPNANSGNAYGIGPIEFGASASVLYGSNTFDSGSDFVEFEVNANGVTRVASQRSLALGQTMEFAGGRIYGANGRVLDPAARTQIGTFTNIGGGGGGFFAAVMAVDAPNKRVFFLTDPSFSGTATLSAYDTETFLPLGSVTLSGITGRPAGLVRWGTSGLAFCTTRQQFDSQNVVSRVYLVQTALVDPGAAIPSSLQLGAAAYSAQEGVPAATVTVTRTGGVGSASSASYSTADGTATAGSDYTASSGTVSFAPGELTKTITIPILDDNFFEGSETFTVTLSNASGASLGTPASAVVTINDNDPAPFISAPVVAVPEGDSGTTDFELPVRLTSATSKVVTVNYATGDSTATAGADYVAASGTLTFQPGETEKRIPLRIIGDSVEEPNEFFNVFFTNAVNASAPTNTVVTILDDERPTVQFASQFYTASEGDGRALITVTRFGSVANPASVDYATVEDTRPIPCAQIDSARAAFGRCDYSTTFDTLNFAAGERQKTFAVPLVDDGHDEPDERVRLQIFRGVGVTLGQPTLADLIITDNDAADAANPLDSHQFFVRQHYLDFLSREPEAGEPWTGVLARCANAFNTDPASPSAACDRNIVSSSFFRSREFELKGYFVYRFYRATFNRWPRYPEFVFDMRRVTGQTPEDVLAKRRAFAEMWVQRAEFLGVYGSMSNAQLVDALLARYQLSAINAPDPAAPDGETFVRLTRDELVAALDQQRLTKAQVLRAFVESREVDAAEFNGAFVAMQYFGYLRRDPDQSGFNAWLAVLNRGDGFRVMIDGFMNSQEYRLRFGKP